MQPPIPPRRRGSTKGAPLGIWQTQPVEQHASPALTSRLGGLTPHLPALPSRNPSRQQEGGFQTLAGSGTDPIHLSHQEPGPGSATRPCLPLPDRLVHADETVRLVCHHTSNTAAVDATTPSGPPVFSFDGSSPTTIWMNNQALVSTLSAAADWGNPSAGSRSTLTSPSSATPVEMLPSPTSPNTGIPPGIPSAAQSPPSPASSWPPSSFNGTSGTMPPSSASPALPSGPSPSEDMPPNDAGLTLFIRLGVASRTFHVAASVLDVFTAWSLPRVGPETDANPNSGTRSNDSNSASSPPAVVTVEFTPASEGGEGTLCVDLSGLIPASAVAAMTAGHSSTIEELDAHLDALGELLEVIQRKHRSGQGHYCHTQHRRDQNEDIHADDPGEDDREREEHGQAQEMGRDTADGMDNIDDCKDILDIATLWRLGGLRGGLGLDRRWLAWLRRQCMGRFVAGLAAVDGWFGMGWPKSDAAAALAATVGDRDGHRDGEEAEAEDNADDELVMERALNVCLVFGWKKEFHAVAERLAYVCGVEEDRMTGQRVLVKPDGRKVEASICGRPTVDSILSARCHVVQHVIATAKSSLCSWTSRIGQYPCVNVTCNANRIAGLNAFLLWSGLYPAHGNTLARPLREVVIALKYITATDAELMTAATDSGSGNGRGGQNAHHPPFVPAWAVRVREAYGGTCTKCNGCGATNMLFPLEDLLSDISCEIQTRLAEFMKV